MGYKSDAQRKAVHASKADGGKGNPNKLKVKGFDFKSKKAKNKRDYTAKEEKDFSMHNISARKTEGTIEEQEKLRNKNSMKMKTKTSPALVKLSASCKASAKRKFKVYPSAYANMWAAKTQRQGKC